MSYYGLSGKIIANPGKRDELTAILLKAATLLEQNNECIHYVVGINNTPDEICVTELWTDKESHDASLEPLEIRELIMGAHPFIKDMSGSEVTVLGGKGVPSDK